MKRFFWGLAGAGAIILSACSSGAPMAPIGLDKRPANSPAELAALSAPQGADVPSSDQPAEVTPSSLAPNPPGQADGSARLAPRNFVFSDYSAPGGFLTLSASDRDAVLAQARSASGIRILCRTDRVRPSKTGRAAALRRGAVVRRFLIAQGVPPQKIRLYVRSCGAFIADNATPTGKAKNRRVEIVFS